MLAAKGVRDASNKSVRVLVAAVQASLHNHEGKTVRRVGEGAPGRWGVADCDA